MTGAGDPEASPNAGRRRRVTLLVAIAVYAAAVAGIAAQQAAVTSLPRSSALADGVIAFVLALVAGGGAVIVAAQARRVIGVVGIVAAVGLFGLSGIVGLAAGVMPASPEWVSFLSLPTAVTVVIWFPFLFAAVIVSAAVRGPDEPIRPGRLSAAVLLVGVIVAGLVPFGGTIALLADATWAASALGGDLVVVAGAAALAVLGAIAVVSGSARRGGAEPAWLVRCGAYAVVVGGLHLIAVAAADAVYGESIGIGGGIVLLFAPAWVMLGGSAALVGAALVRRSARSAPRG